MGKKLAVMKVVCMNLQQTNQQQLEDSLKEFKVCLLGHKHKYFVRLVLLMELKLLMLIYQQIHMLFLILKL